MLSGKIQLFPNDISINYFSISTAEIHKKMKIQWTLSKEKTREKNDKLVFHTLKTSVTMFYGLVSGSYANKVASSRLIIIKDIQFDKWNPQEETETERGGGVEGN